MINIYTPIFAQKKSIFFAGEKQYIHLTLKYTQEQLSKLCEDIYKGFSFGKRVKSLNLTVFLPAVEFNNTILVPEYIYSDVTFCDWEVVDNESIKCIFQIANQEFDAPMIDNKTSLFTTLEKVAEYDPCGEYTPAIKAWEEKLDKDYKKAVEKMLNRLRGRDFKKTESSCKVLSFMTNPPAERDIECHEFLEYGEKGNFQYTVYKEYVNGKIRTTQLRHPKS